MENDDKKLKDAIGVISKQAAELLQSGIPPERVEIMLVNSGLDRDISSTIVNKLKGDYYRYDDTHKRVGCRNMIIGFIVGIIGLIITLVSLSSASSGGTYIIAWGAIIFGGIQFLKGFFQYVNKANL